MLRWLALGLSMASPAAADNYAALAPVSDGARLEARHLTVTPERVTISDDWFGKGQAGFVLHLPSLSDDGDFTHRLPRPGTEFVEASITHNGQAVTPRLVAQAWSEGQEISASLEARGIPLNPYDPGVDEALAGLSPAELEAMIARGDLRGDGSTPGWAYMGRLEWQGAAQAQSVVVQRPVVLEYELGIWVRDGRFAPDEYMRDGFCIDAPVMRAVQRRLDSGARPEDYTLRMFSVSLSGDEWGEGAITIPRISVEVDKTRPDILTAFCGMGEITRSGETTFATSTRDHRPEPLRVLFIIPN